VIGRASSLLNLKSDTSHAAAIPLGLQPNNRSHMASSIFTLLHGLKNGYRGADLPLFTRLELTLIFYGRGTFRFSLRTVLNIPFPDFVMVVPIVFLRNLIAVGREPTPQFWLAGGVLNIFNCRQDSLEHRISARRRSAAVAE